MRRPFRLSSRLAAAARCPALGTMERRTGLTGRFSTEVGFQARRRPRLRRHRAGPGSSQSDFREFALEAPAWLCPLQSAIMCRAMVLDADLEFNGMEFRPPLRPSRPFGETASAPSCRAVTD